MSHSKFQESNALAEISKLLKQQQQSAPAERLVVETKKIEEVHIEIELQLKICGPLITC